MMTLTMISMMIFNESTTPRADIIRRTIVLPFVESAVPVVQRAMRSGCFPEGDPSLALFMLIAGVSQAVTNYGGDDHELRAKAAHLLDNLTNRRPK